MGLVSFVFSLELLWYIRVSLDNNPTDDQMQTSLNMPGFSITLLLLPEKDANTSPSVELLVSLLDEEPDVPGWKYASRTVPSPLDQQIHTSPIELNRDIGQVGGGIPAFDPDAFVESIKKAAQALIRAEPEITKMDTIAGDGDCGLTLKVSKSL